jgi:hypothetical protein
VCSETYDVFIHFSEPNFLPSNSIDGITTIGKIVAALTLKRAIAIVII